MPRAEARIATDHPSRLLIHLCQHAAKIGNTLGHLHGRAPQAGPEVLDVTWTDTTGTLRLSWGTCTLHAGDDTLSVHAESADEAGLKRVQDIVTADLERFGRRDHLTVNWTSPDAPGPTSVTSADDAPLDTGACREAATPAPSWNIRGDGVGAV